MKKTLYLFIYILCDVAAVALATVFIWALRSNFNLVGQITAQNLLLFFAIAAIVTVFCGFVYGIYYTDYKYIGFEELIRIGLCALTVMIVELCFQQLAKQGLFLECETIFTKSILIAFGIFIFGCITVFRCVPRAIRWLRLNKGGSKNLERAIVIGAGDSGAEIVRRLRNDSAEKIWPVGFIDNDRNKYGVRVSGVKVYGSIKNLDEIIKKRLATVIIISLHNISDAEMNDLIKVCSNTGLPVKVYREFGDANKRHLKDFSIEELLFRPMVKPDIEDVQEFVNGKTVLVTGGVGSIGSELCRQVLQYGCKKLYIFDIHENGLFELDAELKKAYGGRYELRLGSVREKARVDEVLSEQKFDIVIHAAAHKHVPMMEINPEEAVKNNIFGTRNVILSCTEHGVGKFVMISTDKAVHPTNIMGATKRACEIMVRNYDGVGGCEMCAVRFGNVLGSNGSVIPTFKRQIAEGGPVTVTHKDITRYFMTIPEAVSLVLCAGKRARGGEIFVLNMEKPIRIYDLAVNMIRLSGKEPERDIKIEFTGLRPGEKLYEELSFDSEDVSETDHSKIFVVNGNDKCEERLEKYLSVLHQQLETNQGEREIRNTVFELIGEEIEKNGMDSGRVLAGIASV